MDPDDVALALLPGYRNYLVYCDEASIHGREPYYGWGSVWVPAEARGRLSRLITDVRREHFLSGQEVKWTKVKERTLPFFEALLDSFFRRNWILFHCIVIKTAIVRDDLFDGGLPEARIHHLSTFLRNKITFFSRDAAKKYHIRVDPLPSSYSKEDEKLWKIADAMLKQKLGDSRIATLFTRDSKDVRGIQLADFLLGAVLCPWNGNVEPGSPKDRISRRLYEYLGWSDHHADTDSSELKFNIWHFYDRSLGPRTVRARPVQLKHPITVYRTR